jgi:hypothetical protein
MATKKKSTSKAAGRKSASKTATRTNVRDSQTGTEPPRRSVAEHSEHPESAGDSTVRHADQHRSAPSAGRKGFPQGEYDVNQPAKAGAKKQSIKQTLLEQHAATQSGDTQTVLGLIKHQNANRLSVDERELAVELLPIGAIIEHEAPYRWRVRSPVGGGNRFGHGATAKEAIDSFVLGNADVNGAQAAARRFSELPASQQREIEDRDNAAARSVGQAGEDSPDVLARRQALSFSQAADKRAPTPQNAASDGAEVSTATNRAGRGEDPSVPAGQAARQQDRSARAAKNRSAARRRSGAKAKK